ncbi:protein BIG GRAIN 1-like A [Silene latifolia]|uniref:protein BIG GRAIN 1-like A n=1 Tax=Silene latifolia TaxID=37657 RepID=UPI003D776646
MNSHHIHHYNLHNNYNNTNNITNTANYPSFSSSLLEEIYRSFDDDKSRIDRRRVDRYVLEQWIDKEKEKEKEKEKNIKFRRNSMPETGNYRQPLYSSSSTSSSDSSSCIGGFSSSDTESVYGAPARMSAKVPSLKPIRTAANTADSATEFVRKSYSGDNTAAAKAKAKKSKKDGKLQHALKLYADLKKVKQPISPGGKIASFLNSLFNSGNSRKSKVSPPSTAAVPTAMKSASVPSSASSYSRSCLSKTPSSAGRYERRSVRFCPVSVVVDETGEKSVYNDVVSRMDVCGGDEVDLKAEIREKQRRVEEAAKELLKNYRSNQIRKEFKVNVISNVDQGINSNVNVNMCGFEDEDEDDDDEESCCSSDLFELDNLLEIGVGDRYCQELPVYETTHVGRNRAIANGSIL